MIHNNNDSFSYLVDPIQFTNFTCSNFELELKILFCIAVAGKNATTTAKNLEKFLKNSPNLDPFAVIHQYDLDELTLQLKSFGFGCYTLKAKGFHWIANSGIDLKSCTWQDLEKCPGIGQKSSRYFILHTRKGSQVACLDTHILKWLSDYGHSHVPKSSPQSKKIYKKYENIFLEIAKKQKTDPASLDLAIWNEYRNK